ncbi:MAG: preprotein translocase subunit SecG [Planctomycetes bacterium]|nr:preprotein translocase subunit SecG [Planctomycetota bacterium]
MMVLPILAVSFIMKIVAALFILCAVVLILIILIQKGKGGGLSSAFGGGAAGGVLGTKTGDFLTWTTIMLVAVFLGLAVLMAKFYKPTISDYNSSQPAARQQAMPDEEQTQQMPDEPAVADVMTDVNEME